MRFFKKGLKSKSFQLLSLNAGGLTLKKFKEFIIIVASSKPDAALICESWLPSTTIGNLQIDGYDLFQRDRPLKPGKLAGHGGGVLLLCPLQTQPCHKCQSEQGPGGSRTYLGSSLLCIPTHLHLLSLPPTCHRPSC